MIYTSSCRMGHALSRGRVPAGEAASRASCFQAIVTPPSGPRSTVPSRAVAVLLAGPGPRSLRSAATPTCSPWEISQRWATARASAARCPTGHSWVQGAALELGAGGLLETLGIWPSRAGLCDLQAQLASGMQNPLQAYSLTCNGSRFRAHTCRCRQPAGTLQTRDASSCLYASQPRMPVGHTVAQQSLCTGCICLSSWAASWGFSEQHSAACLLWLIQQAGGSKTSAVAVLQSAPAWQRCVGVSTSALPPLLLPSRRKCRFLHAVLLSRCCTACVALTLRLGAAAHVTAEHSCRAEHCLAELQA